MVYLVNRLSDNSLIISLIAIIALETLITLIIGHWSRKEVQGANQKAQKAEQEVELKKAEFYEVLQVNKDFTDRMVSEAELKAKSYVIG